MSEVRDTLRELCIRQGYVPGTCQLAGQLVWGLVNEGQDPCGGCEWDRAMCKGRPKQADRPKAAPKPLPGWNDPHPGPLPSDGRGRRSLKHVHYFLGIDPAPGQTRAANDGALVAGRARPRNPNAEPTSLPSDWYFEYTWAYRLRNASARQWSGLMHAKHQQFNFTGMLMDPGGGGLLIMQELKEQKQIINGVDTTCVPILCPDIDGGVVNGYFLLNLFRRGDSGIAALWPLLAGDDNLVDAMHTSFQQAVEHSMVAFPPGMDARAPEAYADWSEERKWAMKDLSAVVRQLQRIEVLTRDDGTWALTSRNARQFPKQGKNDLAYAAIYAYIRFLVWLKSAEMEFSLSGDEDAGVYVMKT